VIETSVVPPTLQDETTEALLCRLGNLGRMHARLTTDPSGRAVDHDDLVDAIRSTMRVIDCVLLDRDAYRDEVARDCRVKALTAAGLSTELRRWVDDVEIRTEDPGPTQEWLERATAGVDRPGSLASAASDRGRRGSPGQPSPG
jgi:hypothetical protein